MSTVEACGASGEEACCDGRMSLDADKDLTVVSVEGSSCEPDPSSECKFEPLSAASASSSVPAFGAFSGSEPRPWSEIMVVPSSGGSSAIVGSGGDGTGVGVRVTVVQVSTGIVGLVELTGGGRGGKGVWILVRVLVLVLVDGSGIGVGVLVSESPPFDVSGGVVVTSSLPPGSPAVVEPDDP